MFLDANTILELATKNGYKPNLDLVAGFVKAVTDKGAAFGLNTPERLAMFIGQCMKESGGFTTFKEGGTLSYLKSKSYYPFYGRGPIQVTKTSGCYPTGSQAIFGNNSGVTNPDKFLDPYYGTLLSMHWWQQTNANKVADTGNVNALSKKVMGGDNGTLPQRAKYTNDTIALFKTKQYNVILKGETAPRKYTLWNYLKTLGTFLKK
jgi:putative chitinase